MFAQSQFNVMGFEGCSTSKILGLSADSLHKRSKSLPGKRGLEEDSVNAALEASHRIKLDMENLTDRVKTKKKQLPNDQIQNSLRQEIMQLERKLQDQVAVRLGLEKALGYRTSSHEIPNEISIPKPATELIKEIAALEFEVVHLEQYLLALYRKAFYQQISSLSPSMKDNKVRSPLTTPRERNCDMSKSEIVSRRDEVDLHSLANAWKESNGFTGEEEQLDSVSRRDQVDLQSLANAWKESNGITWDEKQLGSGVQRCHSLFSQHSALSTATSPPAESLGKAVRACHSQPLSMMEYAENAASNVISLAEHLGTCISDHIPETPNKLAEEMIKCMSAIYCKLADPHPTNHGTLSPTSSLSSVGAFSPKDQYDVWSPVGFRKDSSFDVQLDNPFHVEGLKEFSGPYSTMIEVQCLYRDSQKLGDIEHMLDSFRSLISRLEEIDPRKMNHEEKLAFWINIHNALVMHAFLAYGIPQNNLKRAFLLLKAAYNVGGHVISADVIQSSILGCRMSRPGQWLHLLLSSRTKFKAGDEQQAYAIEQSEPFLHFALCSGSQSDPAVRVYTPKRVYQELAAAKEEYIRATFGVQKNKKILLPKIVESFAKDSGLCPAGILEMVHQCLPESLRKNIKKYQQERSRKNIEWVPHNFTFRYLISKEVVK